ncbi:MAG: glycoside hydrolase family 3 C-terminal domain-containing protein [Candidatus Omnitrophota bacterium]|jgi:beta-glucosidase
MNRPGIFLLALVLFLLFSGAAVYGEDQQVEKKIDELIKKMTLGEKVTLIAGNEMETYSIDRLGIPKLKCCDGPVGVARSGPVTAFPSSICMAATWDPDLIYKVSTALAEEVKGKDRNMSLAPCVNIHRVPMGGRNFESFGEDPYLSSRLAVAYVKGLQDNKVLATVKHYACNNQEWERGTIDVVIDERALREIYLPAFEAAVKEGGSWSVMASYNKVNGYHSSENDHLLNEILKKEWGFKGFVVSDWGGTHSTVNAANYGLDLEMPRGDNFNSKLVSAVNNGQVKEAVIDDKVRRILRAMFWLGLFDANPAPNRGSLNTAQHKEAAFLTSREGIVLLKNTGGVLPIDITKIKSIAVIGPNAAANRFGGGGSSEVTPAYNVSPLDGLKKRLGNKVAINYALGCKLEGEVVPIETSAVQTVFNGKKVNGFLGEYFNNQGLEGAPAVKRVDKHIDFSWGDGPPADGIQQDHFSARWTAKLTPPKTGEYEVNLRSDDGSRLFIDGREIINSWKDHGEETKSTTMKFEAGKEYDLRVEFYENSGGAVVKLGWDIPRELAAEAAEVAKKSDIAIVFIGLSGRFESECFDRKDINLPDGQNDLVKKVVAANKNTVVVLNSGAAVIMNEWVNDVPAILEMWYPGQEGGNAIADVLLGYYNPSGKLPTTFPVRWEDCSAYSTYPGKNGKVYYSDGIFVGYRYFDKQGTKVLFPFGHGLSYTTFEYSNLTITPGAVSDGKIDLTASFDLKNTGRREGAEVAQLYIREVAPGIERPVRELKGFKRVNLKPGETLKVTFKLDKRSFAFYDVDKKDWTANPGEFEIEAGSSSRDIKLKGTFTLQKGKML